MSEVDPSKEAKKDRRPRTSDEQAARDRRKQAARNAKAAQSGGNPSASDTKGDKRKKSLRSKREPESDEDKKRRRAKRAAAKAKKEEASTEASAGDVSRNEASQTSMTDTEQPSIAPAMSNTSAPEDRKSKRAKEAEKSRRQRLEDEVSERNRGKESKTDTDTDASRISAEPSKSEATTTAAQTTSDTTSNTKMSTDSKGDGADSKQSAADTDSNTKRTQEELDKILLKKKAKAESEKSKGADLTEDQRRAKRHEKRAQKAERSENGRERKKRAKPVQSNLPTEGGVSDDSGYDSGPASEAGVKSAITTKEVTTHAADTPTQTAVSVPPTSQTQTSLTSATDVDTKPRKLTRREEETEAVKAIRRDQKAEDKRLPEAQAAFIRQARAESTGRKVDSDTAQPTVTVPSVTATVDRTAATDGAATPTEPTRTAITEPTAGLPDTTSPTVTTARSDTKPDQKKRDQKKKPSSRVRKPSKPEITETDMTISELLPDTAQFTPDTVLTSAVDSGIDATAMLKRWIEYKREESEMSLTLTVRTDIHEIDPTAITKEAVSSWSHALYDDLAQMTLIGGMTLARAIDTGLDDKDITSLFEPDTVFSVIGRPWPQTRIPNDLTFAKPPPTRTLTAFQSLWRPIANQSIAPASVIAPAATHPPPTPPVPAPPTEWTDATTTANSAASYVPGFSDMKLPTPEVGNTTADTVPLPLTAPTPVTTLLPPTITATAPATTVTSPLPIATSAVDYSKYHTRIDKLMEQWIKDQAKNVLDTARTAQTASLTPTVTVPKESQPTERKLRASRREGGAASKTRQSSRDPGTRTDKSGSRTGTSKRGNKTKSRSRTRDSSA